MTGPYANFLAPNYLSAFTVIPTGSLTALTTSTVGVMSINFSNTTDTAIDVTITNTASNPVWTTVSVPPGTPFTVAFPYFVMVGIKWVASATGVTAQVQGYI